jgi:hypothetical protein
VTVPVNPPLVDDWHQAGAAYPNPATRRAASSKGAQSGRM